MEIRTVGIDLGKSVFHLVGVNTAGQVIVRKEFSREKLHITANLHVQRIGMEACLGAHFLGRALRAQGHDARLMPTQFVRPYVVNNKNDFIDAEGIAEAVWRPKTRFVPIKTDDPTGYAVPASCAGGLGTPSHIAVQPDPWASA